MSDHTDDPEAYKLHSPGCECPDCRVNDVTAAAVILADDEDVDDYDDEPCYHDCDDSCYDEYDEWRCNHSHCFNCGGCQCPGYCDDHQTYNLRPAETGGAPDGAA